MKLNPEFRKNLWLEFRGRRLFAMPITLGAIFAMAFLWNDSVLDASISWIPIAIYGIITFIWGTRLAAESVVREVNIGTWSWQRMSAVGPWSMVIGKLFGATSFVWYGNILCFVFYFLCSVGKTDLHKIISLIVILVVFGILAHVISLLASLYSMRYRRSFERFEVLFYQFAGMMVAFPMLRLGVWGALNTHVSKTIYWYGHNYNHALFVLSTISVLVVWAVVGLYLVMRDEYQLQNSPLVWLLFVISISFWAMGLKPIFPSRSYDTFPIPEGTMVTYMLVMGLVYLLACGESRDAIRLHKLQHYIKTKQVKRFFAIMPRAIITLPVLFAVVWYAATHVRQPFAGPHGERFMELVPYCMTAAVLFVLRDVSFIYYMAIRNKGKGHNNVVSIMILLMLYTLFPVILSSLKWFDALSIFIPWAQKNKMMIIMPVAGQAAVLLGLLYKEWFVHKIVNEKDGL